MASRPRHVAPPNLKDGRIRSNVALLHDQHDPETEPLRVSYRYYNDGMCGIRFLNQAEARDCLKALRAIGRHTRKAIHTQNSGVDVLPVENLGDYKQLFNGLTEDVDLKEHKLSDKARLFYFLEGAVCQVVAILHGHLESKKNR